MFLEHIPYTCIIPPLFPSVLVLGTSTRQSNLPHTLTRTELGPGVAGYQDISILLPNLLALHPGAEHIAMAVENDQVSVCTGPEGTLLVLDPEASSDGKDERRRPRSAYTCQRSPRRVECRAFDRFSERATRELHKVADALVQGDHAKEETGIDEQNCWGGTTEEHGRNGPPGERRGAF